MRRKDFVNVNNVFCCPTAQLEGRFRGALAWNKAMNEIEVRVRSWIAVQRGSGLIFAIPRRRAFIDENLTDLEMVRTQRERPRV
jgi:hypothetical protein